MGFHSKCCSCCGYSFTNDFVGFISPEISEAFRTVVLLRPKMTLIGTYDGYGTIYNTDFGFDIENTDSNNPFIDDDSAVMMHQFCWERIGRPRWNAEMPPSAWAADQGYFLENPKEYEDYYLGRGEKRTQVDSWNVTNQQIKLYEREADDAVCLESYRFNLTELNIAEHEALKVVDDAASTLALMLYGIRDKTGYKDVRVSQTDNESIFCELRRKDGKWLLTGTEIPIWAHAFVDRANSGNSA